MILSRWLPIDLSMARFGLLFFFAVTGLTLNHADWFPKQQHTFQARGAIDPKDLGKEAARLEIVEYFRNSHVVRGAVTAVGRSSDDAPLSSIGAG